MSFNIEFEPNLSSEDENIIYEGLLAHNVEDLNLPLEEIRTKRFAFVVRQEKTIMAGLVGNIKYRAAFIETLWVDKALRKRSIGKELLLRAEEYAKNCNCAVIFLNTLTLANVKFYEKAGFIFEFERPNYLGIGGQAMRYFRKSLTDEK